jgi:hypothetical protein
MKTSIYILSLVVTFASKVDQVTANLDLDCPEGHICWPKCCDQGSTWDLENKKCSANLIPPKRMVLYDMEIDRNDFPTLTEVETDNLLPVGDTFKGKLRRFCKGRVNYKTSENTVKLLTNNRIFVDDGKTVEVYNQGFCVETFVDQSKNFSQISAFVCLPYSPALRLPSQNKSDDDSISCVSFFLQKVSQNFL